MWRTGATGWSGCRRELRNRTSGCRAIEFGAFVSGAGGVLVKGGAFGDWPETQRNLSGAGRALIGREAAQGPMGNIVVI